MGGEERALPVLQSLFPDVNIADMHPGDFLP
jgi:hypothetical protein